MCTIRVANTPASWGALEFDLPGGVLGYAQVLDEIAETGYAGTELGDWGYMPTEPEVLRAALTARGLALVGAFVPVALARPEALAEGRARALRVARLLRGAAGLEPFVVLADDNGAVPARTQHAGRVTAAMGLDDAQWRVFARGAEAIAQAVRQETGLPTVFHHHCGGYVETPAEIERLMARTDPALLGLCLDTGHALFGGGDPLALLRRYGARIWHVHYKDHDPAVAAQAASQGGGYFGAVRQGVFCELGQGAVDFRAVTEALRAMDYAGWIVVEQDVLPGMGAPKESARRNRAFMQGLGL